MKILAIRGQNLASLKGGFELDLVAPPLGGLGLFAIAGPVGAGKSTILDAMCVALFGRTPRLSGRGGAPLTEGKDALRANDPRTLARKGAALAFAEVDFLGVDGQRWRARWQVRRARGQAFGRLLDDEQLLTNLETGQHHGTTNQEARQATEARLGLSFDELTRSVLLSQGGFAAFLQARPEERAALLEKITGTAIYGELSTRAFMRAKDAAARLVALRAERARVHTLDDDARASLLAQTAARAAQRDALEAEVAMLAIAAAHAEDRARRAHDVERARARHDAALAAERAARVAEDEALIARERATPTLEAIRAIDAGRAALRVDELARAAHEAREAARAAEDALAVRMTARDALIARRREAAHVLEQHQALVPLLPRVADLCEQLDALRGARTQLEGARALLASHSARAEQAHVALEAAREQLDAARADVQACVERVHPRLRELPVRVARAAVARAQARRAREDAERLGAELRVEERALERIGHAAARARLVDGEPCPLCGALEHPFAHAPELSTVAAQREAVEALRAAVAAARDRASAASARAEALGAESEDAAVDVIDALDPLDAGALDAEDAALRARERVERAEADALGRAHEHEQARVEAEAQRTFGTGQVELLATRERELTTTLSRALAGTGLAPEGDVTAVARALASRARAVRAARTQLDALDAERTRDDAETRDVERALDVARTTAQGAALAHDTARERAAALDAERAQRLEGSTVDGLVRACGAAVDEAVARHASARMKRSAAAEALEGARAELSRLAPSDVGPGSADAWRAARARLKQMLDDDARERARLGVDDEARARVVALDASIASEESSSRVWAELNELIGSHDGAKFRAFAQGLTLETLIHHANAHLALLSERFRLERATPTRAGRAELALCVVDRDAGDERRAVQSLSGGETFLVSLALALGLASLSSSRVRVESLFIDEGFSSLDPDALEVALAALDTLRSTGRQVGIISHVPALADRIGVQVRVVPLGDGRSRVDVRAG